MKVSWASVFFCWFKVTCPAQGYDTNSCWWTENKANLLTLDFSYKFSFPGSFLRHPVFVLFQLPLACVTLACFLFLCELAQSCHTHYPNNCTLLIRESLLWAITPQFSIALMTLENIQPSVVVIIAHWDTDIMQRCRWRKYLALKPQWGVRLRNCFYHQLRAKIYLTQWMGS